MLKALRRELEVRMRGEGEGEGGVGDEEAQGPKR